MKKVYYFTLFILMCNISVYSQITIQREVLDGNNIKSYFQNTGIFNRNTINSTSAGFEWPKGTNQYAIFSSGLTIATYYNNAVRMASAFYNGELAPGYCIAGIPYTNSNFKIYKVKVGDNQNNNPDWANWGLMVPYGAPYVDVNNNNYYEPAIDIPGIVNAQQTIFICLTDGYSTTHTSLEGFGGGTQPLFAEYHFTAWCYNKQGLYDVQFLEWDIINKSNYSWDSTIFSIVCNPDLGDGNDDYIGSDTIRKLGYCYNGDNNDPIYGAAPPAVGILLLKGAINKNIIPNVPLGMTSFTLFYDTTSNYPVCERQPYGEIFPAYKMLKGLKKDGCNFMNPRRTPPSPTFYVYSENAGWTEYTGSMQNCGGNTGVIIPTNPSGERRFCLCSGKVKVNSNDTQNIIAAQLIKRGSSNSSSVYRLKEYADSVSDFYISGYIIKVNNISNRIPTEYKIYSNYPNPFNPLTKIQFDVMKTKIIKINIFDIMGKELEVLVNESMQPGTYEVEWNGERYSSGIYFYRMQAGDYIETRKMILMK